VESLERSDHGGRNEFLLEGVGRLGLVLACVLVLQQVEVPVVYADDSNLSAYEKRKIENEKRKEMLRSLREKAEQGASRVDAIPAPPVYTPPAAPIVPKAVSPPPQPAVVAPKAESSSSSSSLSMPKMDMPKMDMPKMDMPKMDIPKMDMPKMDMPKMDMPKMPSFSFGGGKDGENTPVAPPPQVKPSPVKPSPPSVPVEKKYTPPNVAMPQNSPAKVSSQGDTLDQWRQQQKKDLEARKKIERQAEVKRNKAKKGVMPVWLAEFLLIGTFGGFGFASLVFSSQIAALYKKVDNALTNLFFTK